MMVSRIQIELYFRKQRNHPMRMLMRHDSTMTKPAAGTMGDRVRTERKAQGINQKALARLAGTSQQVISSIERNNQGGTTYVVQIANALKVNPVWLETGKGDKYPARWDVLLDVSTLDPAAQAGARRLVSALASGEISASRFLAIVDAFLVDRDHL